MELEQIVYGSAHINYCLYAITNVAATNITVRQCCLFAIPIHRARFWTRTDVART